MKKIIIISLVLGCALKGARAQDNKGITIGEAVPDLTVTNVIHYKTNTLNIADFKGKLLILDFWATWCGPCVGMIPRMDSLQNIFHDDIQFLPVAYQSAKELNVFYAKLERQSGKHLLLPEVIGDTRLARLFPHQTLPHYVWIGKDGKVKAITDQKQVNAENIRKLLGSGELAVRVKQDEQSSYDRSRPLFFDGTDERQLLMGAQLSGYIPGLGRGIYKDVDFEGEESLKRITARNLTMVELYQLAYRKETKETRVEVADPERLTPKKLSGAELMDWIKDGHAHCYELVVPSADRQKAYSEMQQQLAAYFSEYQASLEKRTVECLVLVRTSAADKLHTAGGEPSASMDAFGARFKSCYLSVFMSRMQTALQGVPMPLVDETGYKGMADLELTADMRSVDAVNAALARYDLKFEKKQAPVELLVIRDRPAGN